MKNKIWFLNTVLAVLITIGLGAAILVRTFAPHIILPKLSIPSLVLISVLALVIDYYVTSCEKRCYVCVAVFSVLSFGILPYAAGFITPLGILIFGFGGGVVFTITTVLFSMIMDRLSSGPAAKAAPFLSGLGLYLASQCLMGIII